MIDKVYLSEEAMPLEFQFCKLRAVAPHYHDNKIVIMIVLKGHVTLHAGCIHQKIKGGEMAFINAGEVYYTEEESENETLVVHVKSSGKIYKKSCAFGKRELTELKMNIMALAYTYYMDELVEEETYLSACKKALKMIEEYFSVSVRALAEYINANFQRKITVTDVANAVGMNGRTVTAVLKREGLGSFSEYLNNIRCAAADRMMLGSKIKVSEVTDLNGFSSVRSFIRDFASYSGRTPLQQRKYYREISKHKFNRIIHIPPNHILQEISRYVGDLYISKWIDEISIL